MDDTNYVTHAAIPGWTGVTMVVNGKWCETFWQPHFLSGDLPPLTPGQAWSIARNKSLNDYRRECGLRDWE